MIIRLKSSIISDVDVLLTSGRKKLKKRARAGAAVEPPQARVRACVASNYTLNNVTISPTYKKPFDLIAKGLL